MKNIKMKDKTKSVLFWIFNIIVLISINAASAVFVVFSFIWQEDVPLPNGRIIEFSFLESLKWIERATIYFFMLLGFVLSFLFIKFLYKEIIRKLDIKKDNLSQDKELELKRESLKIEKEKQELDILKIKAEAGLLTEKEIKKLEDRLC